MSTVTDTRQQVGTRSPGWASEFEAILKAYEAAGGDANSLINPKIATLVISGNKVLGKNQVPGVEIESKELSDGVEARIKVSPGTTLDYPIHLCFGLIPAEGVQRIISEFDIGEGAKVDVLTHCTFPNALDLQHIMHSRTYVRRGASFSYNESHFHGPKGGIKVISQSEVQVEDHAAYSSEFNLVFGRVGELDIDYTADVADYGNVEMTTKAYGWADDEITVRETVRLNGEGSRGIAKSRIAVRDKAHSRVFTTAEGNAPLARGHMDCTEIVRDEAVAENVPMVVVRDDRAQVTHEAAIGSVNKKELETLMARGLDEDSAVDVIIRGMLS